MASTLAFLIPRASVEITDRLTLTVFVRGSLAAHADVLDDLWARLMDSPIGRRLKYFRPISTPGWRALPDEFREHQLSRTLNLRSPFTSCRGIDIAEQVADTGAGARVRVIDLAPSLGVERASSLQFTLDDDAAAAREMVALSAWLLDRLPLLWGLAGYAFDHPSGPSYSAYGEIAALAKRHWCLQLLDMVQLQWTAARSVAGIGWLTLVGEDFACENSFSIENTASQGTSLARDGVSLLRCRHGLAIAAGAAPLRGDINADENLTPYARVSELLQPLLAGTPLPPHGPFAKAEVIQAWRQRFEKPRAWLDADVALD